MKINKTTKLISALELDENVLIDIDIDFDNLDFESAAKNCLSSEVLLKTNETLPNVIKAINVILKTFGAKELPWYEDYEELVLNEKPIQITDTMQGEIVDGSLQTIITDSAGNAQDIYLADHSIENTFYKLTVDNDNKLTTEQIKKDDLTDEQLLNVKQSIILTDKITNKQYTLFIINNKLTQTEI